MGKESNIQETKITLKLYELTILSPKDVKQR
jgi:hypothetical protein